MLKKILNRGLIGIFFLLSLISGIFTGYYSYKLNVALEENNLLQEKRTRSILLADELRQSSDDLTNLARIYALTCDTLYKIQYYSVIDIRNGKKERPDGYEEIYWDLVNGGIEPSYKGGETISIDSLLDRIGVDDTEEKLILLSKKRSDKLALIELEVFDIIESSDDPAEIDSARKKLFDKEYLYWKSRIMEPLHEFYIHIDRRTREDLNKSIDDSRLHLIYIFVFIVITIFSILSLRIAIHLSRKNNLMLIADLNTKNTYLEHAAKIIRHDMHSGINTYIPRGIKSLKRRLDGILNDKQLKTISPPMDLLERGLEHTQKVYKSVFAFTNLVKKDADLETEEVDLKCVLEEFLKTTSYFSQVHISDNLPKDIMVNRWLFSTAIDNLVRNGLLYNDSYNKTIKIYSNSDKSGIIVEDNGRGMSQEDFIKWSKPYIRKEDQKEKGSGLGLNIAVAILDVHGYEIKSIPSDEGTKLLIRKT
jgi:signal transduction histidine kinase